MTEEKEKRLEYQRVYRRKNKTRLTEYNRKRNREQRTESIASDKIIAQEAAKKYAPGIGRQAFENAAKWIRTRFLESFNVFGTPLEKLELYNKGFAAGYEAATREVLPKQTEAFYYQLIDSGLYDFAEYYHENLKSIGINVKR